MRADYSYFYTSIQGVNLDPGWRWNMPHDDRLTETSRGRRIRDRRRIVSELEQRSSWFRSVHPDALMRGRSGVLVGGCEADWWYARQFYSARKQCRGPCCANTRRFRNAMTVQEWRAYLDARDQFEELGVQYRASRFSTTD